MVLLAQSFPSLRFARLLKENKHSIVIMSSNPSVVYAAKLEGFNVIVVNNSINFRLIQFLPTAFQRNIKSLLCSYMAFNIINRIKKYKKVEFIITILGMDWQILPAFLNLDRKFYYWDDLIMLNEISHSVFSLAYIKRCSK